MSRNQIGRGQNDRVQKCKSQNRRGHRGVLLAGAILLGMLGLSGCGKTGGYAQVSEDIADTFPLEAEPAGENPQLADADGPYAVVHTTAGDITILLYEEQAPKAVENFVGLARQGYYDGTKIFYVKKDKLAQMGKPNPEEGAVSPDGQPLVYGEEKSLWGGPFADEFHDGLHNFPGAVGMAGSGQDNNLSQFYFVVDQELPEDERVVSASMYINELVRQTSQELNARNDKTPMTEEEVQAVEDELNEKIQSINTQGIPEAYMGRYQPAVDRYMETGGTWGLDYKQTVFGQIIKGLNVAKAITQVKVNAADRSPKQELVIESIEVFETLPEDAG